MKKTIKENLLFAVLLGLVLLAQTLDYNDQLEQHRINCNSETYVADNNINCTGEQK